MTKELVKCGIVMPISGCDNYAQEHWANVLTILSEAANDAGMSPNLVSDSDDSGVIHERIIKNLYENPIVICDVSNKNPNVMFELGMRLAFDKPTIIIKDEKTSYSFDTGVIEHLEYSSDLNYLGTKTFKEKLSDKLKITFEKANNDKNYTSFLGHFGRFVISEVKEREVSPQEFLVDKISNLENLVLHLNKNIQDGNSYELKNRTPDSSNIKARPSEEDYSHFFLISFDKEIYTDTLENIEIFLRAYHRRGLISYTLDTDSLSLNTNDHKVAENIFSYIRALLESKHNNNSAVMYKKNNSKTLR